MPIDPTIFSDVSDGDVLEAKDIRDRAEELQRFLNGRIGVPRDVSSAAFVDTQHIVKPEFYGGPSPRIEGVSSDTIYRKRSGNVLDSYYRHEASGSTKISPPARASSDTPTSDFASPSGDDINVWHPIEGMSATIHCPEIPHGAICLGSLYTYEKGGTTSDNHDFSDDFLAAQTASLIIAEFMLFVDTGNGPVAQQRTRRRLFASGADNYKCRRMNHSFVKNVTLEQGENKVSYRCFYRMEGIASRRAIHLYARARNFVVDVHYR
jgi:hypothetical protein